MTTGSVAHPPPLAYPHMHVADDGHVCRTAADHARWVAPKFEPGDRVRWARNVYPAGGGGRRRAWFYGTVVPHGVHMRGVALVRRDLFPTEPVHYRDDELELAGTRCLPDHAMSNQQLREHLAIAHRWPQAGSARRSQGDTEQAHAHLVWLHTLAHQAAAIPTEDRTLVLHDPIPHTHRKAVP